MHGCAVVPKENTRHQSLSYRVTPGDEVEDMYILLNEVKRQIPSIAAVSSGAIASDYQRLRVESVCSRLGLVSLAYLWKQDQSLLLQEMITSGIFAITVKVAAMGLDPAKHLGKDIAYLQSYLHKLKGLYGINECGEGGEYETLTLDCPLFVNAHIVLDDFQVIRHSSDAIAPVGVLHPLAFHLEHKTESVSLNGHRSPNDLPCDNISIYEVHDDHVLDVEATSLSVGVVSDPVEITESKLMISKTKKDGTFSICCGLLDSCKTLTGLEDLKILLKIIEKRLFKYGFGWENVLYVHLYIDDMDQFAMANEMYVNYITQDKCRFGVPSRSTIELPLLQVGLGRAYLEVLVASDPSKRVLHVQSISCWAPSCIGPYSQATLHEDILHMAGQLGLDPPTMALHKGGLTTELEQALQNCEAVARSFGRSISTSAIVFVVYCSRRIPSSERHKIQEEQNKFLEKMKLLHFDSGSNFKVLSPINLYVLVSDLPKRALVEVKPILHVPRNVEMTIEKAPCLTPLNYWGFQHALWHDSCVQKCIILGKICAAVLNVPRKLVSEICSVNPCADKNDADRQLCLDEGQIERIVRFCIYLLDKVLMQNDFSWEDTTSVRIYFPTSLCISLEALSLMFSNAFHELAEMSKMVSFGEDPIFNLVPVLGAGRSAASINDVITCEVFAQKSPVNNI